MALLPDTIAPVRLGSGPIKSVADLLLVWFKPDGALQPAMTVALTNSPRPSKSQAVSSSISINEYGSKHQRMSVFTHYVLLSIVATM